MATQTVMMAELERVYLAAKDDPEFNTDARKIDKAIKAFQYNKAEDRVRKQLEINAYKTLSAKAFKNARDNGGQIVPPTDAEIAEYVENGLAAWRMKQGK